MIKSEKVSSTNFRTRQQLGRANAAGVEMPSIIRKDSVFLPNKLSDVMKAGLLWL